MLGRTHMNYRFNVAIFFKTIFLSYVPFTLDESYARFHLYGVSRAMRFAFYQIA